MIYNQNEIFFFLIFFASFKELKVEKFQNITNFL